MNPRSLVGNIYETNPGLPKGEPEFDGNLKAWTRFDGHLWQHYWVYQIFNGIRLENLAMKHVSSFFFKILVFR